MQVRRRYPDWGARKLQVVLAREGVELARNTIHRILLRHDLVKQDDQHPPAVQRFEREQPNELWQMDFKGPKGWPQPVGPLSVLDDHSRYLIALAANGSTHGAPVREQLEEAFQRCGVPEAMLMDHGTPWWSQQAPSGHTLSLWLMRQGIRLHWSGIRHPQTQGKVERFHGSLQRALTSGLAATDNCKPGWMPIAGSTTMCARTKPWGCRHRPRCGGPVRGATIRIRRAGSIRPGPGC